MSSRLTVAALAAVALLAALGLAALLLERGADPKDALATLAPSAAGDGSPASTREDFRRPSPSRSARRGAGTGAAPPVVAPTTGGPVAVGFVVRGPAGRPLAGARIETRRASGAPLPPLTTDAGGAARLPLLLPAGEALEGAARHGTFGRVAFGPTPARVEPIELRFEGATGPLEPLAVAPTGSIAGVVALPDDLGGAGERLVVDVICERPDGREPARRAYVEVGDRPEPFAFEGCAPGAWRLRPEIVLPRRNRTGPWVEVDLAPDGRVGGVSLRPDPLRGAIAGVVGDDRGLPLAGATVTVGGRVAETDADGRFELRGVEPGERVVRAEKEGHVAASEPIDHDGGERHLELRLARAGTLRGRVRASAGGVAGVPVFVAPAGEQGWRVRRTETGPDGRWELGGLPPGDYRVKAGRRADPFDPEGGAAVTVRPGASTEVAPLLAR